MENQKPTFRIGLFIDGYTFHKASNFYLHHHFAHSRLSILGFKDFILQKLRTHIPKGVHPELEAHYYHPHEDPSGSDFKNAKGVLRFEEQVKELGIQFHYRNKNMPIYAHGNFDLINDLRMLAIFEEIQLAVLVSTQGFYVDTARFMAEKGIPLLLVGWDFKFHSEHIGHEVHWHTDSLLREHASEYIAMDEEIEQHAKGVAKLFVNPRKYNIGK